MNEEEQEKLYELLFKDTKNKLEETIEKQQKEIKELKEKEKNLLKQLKDSEKELLEVTQNVVSKDKIRKLYDFYKNTGYYELEKVLEELLEE